MRRVWMGGIKVATAPRSELASAIIDDCISRRGSSAGPPRLFFDVNGHGMSLAARDESYRAALDAADLIHADGGFIVSLSRYLASAPIAERSATTDLIHDLAAAGVAQNVTHYLLGASEEVNESCEARLRDLHQGIRIVGRHNGFFGPDHEAEIVEEINAAAPDILWVGLGKPEEQLFAVRNREILRAKWAITCGGCFNYITGHYRRAPLWMREHNLEWLFRAGTSPRLLWRYLTTSPHALWLTVSRADRQKQRTVDLD